MPILNYFVAWIAVTFTQIVIVPRLAVLGIFPDVLTAVVVLVALRHERYTSVWLAFAFAISVDLLDPQKMGWMTLLISIMAYCVGIVRDTIYIENPWFEATMILVATFLYQLAYRFFPEPTFFLDSFPKMLTVSFLIAIYTVAVVGLGVWILRQRFNAREVL
jgi:cell shape-determining protein MreD